MSQQEITFPSQGGVSRRLVPGLDAMIDYESMIITPCSLDVLSSCMRRIDRYGARVGESLRASRCSVLDHSVYVGELAKRLSTGTAWSDHMGCPAISDAMGMWGAMHDVGKIFGGSLVAMVPRGVRAALDSYQLDCKRSVMGALGYPSLIGDEADSLVELCSSLVIRGEMQAIGVGEAFHRPSWERRIDRLAAACPAVKDFSVDGLASVAEAMFDELSKKGSGGSIDVAKMPARWKSLAAPEIMVAFPHYDGNLSFWAWSRAEVPTGVWGGANHRAFDAWLASIGATDSFGLYDLLDAKKHGVARNWYVSKAGVPSPPFIPTGSL